MGDGQTEEALRMVRRASQDGSWVLLNNLHLVLGWIPVLEKELNTMKHHESFRLFMTTEAHDRFPTMLLRLSMKITVEAPPGMRQNLIRTYDAWKPKFAKGIAPLHAQILFTLGWFHAVVQERRTYIPQGWTKFYEFSTSDMRAAGDIVESLCSKVSKSSQIDFLSIRGLLENAIYGGRVDDPVDFSVLQTFLQKYFSEDALECSKYVPYWLSLSIFHSLIRERLCQISNCSDRSCYWFLLRDKAWRKTIFEGDFVAYQWQSRRFCGYCDEDSRGRPSQYVWIAS
jgi:dynein heavy chain 2, cytosolic